MFSSCSATPLTANWVKYPGSWLSRTKLAELSFASYQLGLDSHFYGCMQAGVTARTVTVPPVSTVSTLDSQ